MTPELFIVWLQGYLAATGNTLTPEHVSAITEKLNSVQMRGPYRTVSPVIPQQG